MAKIAMLAASLALAVGQPMAAAQAAPVVASVTDAGQPGGSGPDQKELHHRSCYPDNDAGQPGGSGPDHRQHGRPFCEPDKDAVYLAALTAFLLGIIAAASSHGHDRHPASP